MTTLASYITETRRLLHDANGNFWSDSELTDYINEGRQHIVQDTGCNRVLQSYTIPVSTETIAFSVLPEGNRTIDCLNINLYWGNSRIPLRYLAWTNFNAQLRYWQNYVGRPVAFSMYAPKIIYVGPVTDQAYVAEFDTVVLPIDLVSSNDPETLPTPFEHPVPYYAAYKAKYKEQSYGEAEIFKQQYTQEALQSINSTFTRRIPNPYSSGY
jgi:hypothetical protein